MPIRWNVPQHTAALQRLTAALADKGGAVVLGPDGVGKSTVARLAAEEFCAEHPTTTTRWVIGTPAERVVPFGAFGHLIDIADVGKPAALLRAVRTSLTRAAEQGDLLLIVDEAHDLDILSATLVYQLALTRAARMIVTARADAAPPAIAALWTDGLLERIDLEPPAGVTTAAEVDEFLAELPGPARSVVEFLSILEPVAEVFGRMPGQQPDEFGAPSPCSVVAERRTHAHGEQRVRGVDHRALVVMVAHPSLRRPQLLGLPDRAVTGQDVQIVERQRLQDREELNHRPRRPRQLGQELVDLG
ncbi:AAA family ATPase, partial [Mycobacterium gordonae]|uniref:AAA family ATPase n=1 Tax=Mycobacterium gordonae TaxID=1778 RepID=UPI0020A42248